MPRPGRWRWSRATCRRTRSRSRCLARPRARRSGWRSMVCALRVWRPCMIRWSRGSWQRCSRAAIPTSPKASGTTICSRSSAGRSCAWCDSPQRSPVWSTCSRPASRSGTDMTTYTAPLRDMRFVLHELLEVGGLAALPGYEEATPDVIDAVLEEGARLAENVLFPLNRPGDEEGCTFENGVVRTPKGFKEAYDQFAQGGWIGLSADPAFGGQGLPAVVKVAVDEMVCSANLSFGTYPGLSMGACHAIEHHADDALKALYLPELVDGRWSGTMCLTEPQCGTDLGLIRTRAAPNDD